MVSSLRLSLGVLTSIVPFVLGQGIDSPFDTGATEEISNNFVPGRYIIEYETEGSTLSKRELASSVLDALSSAGLDVSLNTALDSTIFSGASITVTNENTTTLEDIKNQPSVKEAWQVSYVTLDDGDLQAAGMAEWNPHAVTGVDALHKRNITGGGITIAVVDTGVDYSHEAFGSCLGGSCKIAGGWNFMDDPENPTENDVEDCVGHGTFVSSLIVGDSASIKGAAPDSQVKLYKVFGCSSTTTEDYIIAGMLKAYEDKPDIISLSLGSNLGYDTHPVAQLADRISKEIIVLFSAGNSGSTGTYYAVNGGSGDGVIAVASAHAAEVGGWKARAISSNNNETYTFGYVSNAGAPYDLAAGYYKADFTSDNACLTTKTAGENEILFVKLGLCFTGNLYNNLVDSGYSTAFFYLNSADEYINYLNAEYTPGNLRNFGEITYEFGLWLKNQTDAGYEITVQILEDPEAVSFPNGFSGSGQIDYFTSWGPTFFHSFYPHITGPGGVVFGASAGSGNSYAVGSGTSYSCPYIAAVAALYLSQNPGTSAQDYRKYLMSTATDLDYYSYSKTAYGVDNSVLDTERKAPLIQQGAGLVNALAIIDQKTKLTSAAFLELNSTDYRVNDFSISIVNENDEEVTYEISHVPGTSVESRTTIQWVPEGYFPPTGDLAAIVTLSQTSLTLGPGESGSIDVHIDAPTDASEDTGTIFAGKIYFVGDNADAVKVPYMGAQVNAQDWTVWMDDPLVVEYSSDDGYYYNLTTPDRIREYDPTSNDSPRIYYNLRFGCKMYSYDIVDADYDLSSYSYPPVAGQNGYLGPIRSQATVDGSYITFPITYPARFTAINWFGFEAFTNGSVIPPGYYRILSRSVKLFGEYENYEDWQLFVSDPFLIGEAYGAIASSSVYTNATTAPEITLTTDYDTTTTEQLPTLSSFESEESSYSEEPSSTETSSSSSAASSLISSAAVSVSSGTPSLSSSSTAASSCVAETLSGSLDLITDYVVNGFYTNSKTVYNKGDTYWVYLTFKTDQPIASGSKTYLFLEGLTHNYWSSSSVMDYNGNSVASVSANFQTTGTNLTFTWQAQTTTKTTEGTYSFTMRLTEDAQDKITAPGEFELKAYGSEKEYSSILEFAPEPVASPYRNSFYDGHNDVINWIVDIPGSIGTWESVTVSSTVSSFYYSYDCSATKVQIGSNLDEWNNATTFTDATLATQTCAVRSHNYVYDQPIAEDEVLRIHMKGSRQSFIYLFDNTMSIQIVIDGETKSFTLNDMIRVSQTYSAYVMTLTTYTPVCDATSSSTLASSSSTEVSSSSVPSFSSSSAVISSSSEAASSLVSSAVISSSEVSSAASSLVASAVISSSEVSSATSSLVSSAVISSSEISSAASSLVSSAVISSSEISSAASSLVSSTAESSVPTPAAPSSVVLSSDVPSSVVEPSSNVVSTSSSAIESNDVSSSANESSGVESSTFSADESSSAVLSASSSIASVAPSQSYEPTVTGSYSGTDLKWSFTIPGQLGPWTSVTFEITRGLSNFGFEFSAANIFVRGSAANSFTDITTSADTISVLIDYAVGPNDPVVLDVSALASVGSAWTMNAHIVLTTADGKRFFKRAEQSWDLSDTITLDASSVSSSSSTSSSSVSASSIATSSQVSSSTSSSSVSASSIATSSQVSSSTSTSSAVSSSSIVTSSQGVISSSSSLETSSSSSSSSSAVSSSSVVSSAQSVASSIASSVVSAEASSASASASTSSSDVSSSGTTSSAESSVESLTSSDSSSSLSLSSEVSLFTSSAPSAISSNESHSSDVIITSSSVADSQGVSTFTEADISTTVVTITSCSASQCSETAVTTGVTVVTTTISGETTVYTTYCPLTSEESSTVKTEGPATTVVTITSCSEDKCSETAVTTGVTVVTTTISGETTVYTTYCPLTSEESSTVKTAGPATTVVTITSCSEGKCTVVPVTTGVTIVTATDGAETSVYTTYVPLTTSKTGSIEGDVTSTQRITVTSTAQGSSGAVTAVSETGPASTGAAGVSSANTVTGEQQTTSSQYVTVTSTLCTNGECSVVTTIAAITGTVDEAASTAAVDSHVTTNAAASGSTSVASAGSAGSAVTTGSTITVATVSTGSTVSTDSTDSTGSTGSTSATVSEFEGAASLKTVSYTLMTLILALLF